MSLESDLKDALAALKPQIDSTKAALELDETSKVIANLLSEPYGLFWLEYISDVLEHGKLSLYSSNNYVQRGKLDQLIEQLYKTKRHDDLRTLLSFYHQLFGENTDNSDEPRIKYSTLKKMESSVAVKTKETVTHYCLKCYNAKQGPGKLCSKCNSDDIISIIRISFQSQLKTILSNGQYLEIYLKQCLQSTGVELIGYPVSKQAKKAFTNIRYQVDGDIIEVDVHGIALPITLLLCEAKTSGKISPNELRRVEGLYDRLVEKINRISGRQFSVIKLFVITGEFDENISQSSYKRKGWELIGRSSIENLKDILKEIQNGL